MTEPWQADHRPDAAVVARIFARQFPTLAGRAVAYFAEGWDFTVFAVGDDRLVRFPKRAATLPWLARELAVLGFLRPRIEVPVPSEPLLGQPDEEFPFPFVAYLRLPGVPLDEVEIERLPAAAREDLARRLGAAIRVVHAVPPEVLPPAPSPRDDMDAWIAEALDVLTRLEGELPARAVASARRRLEQRPSDAPHTVVTHGDLGPEHVLVDPETGGLTGIIDWADVGPWDAAGDFVGLWVELGESGLEAALDAYGERGDPRLPDRVRFHGTRWLLHQVKHADEGWRPDLRNRWTHRLTQRAGS